MVRYYDCYTAGLNSELLIDARRHLLFWERAVAGFRAQLLAMRCDCKRGPKEIGIRSHMMNLSSKMFTLAKDFSDQIYVMKILGIKNTIHGVLLEFLCIHFVASSIQMYWD